MEVLENTPTLSPSWKYIQQISELTEKLESNPQEVLGIAKLSKAITIPAFQLKGVHCLSKAKNYGMTVNVIVENKLDSKLPEGFGVQNTYTELMPDSKKVIEAIRNISARNITIPKRTVVANLFSANKIPKILTQSVRVSKLEKDIENSQPNEDSTKTQSKEPISNEGEWILEKLGLSSMSEWPQKLQAMARDLLCSYSHIFSKHDLDMGQTDLIKHLIQLTDYNPFKESYRRIPPHLYDEIRIHLKEMLDLGAIREIPKSLVQCNSLQLGNKMAN